MLRNKINDQMKQAMKDKDQVRLDALRYLWSEVKNAEIDKKEELSDEEIVALVGKEVKKRREGIEQMKSGGRDVTEEEDKLKVIEEFLPERMSREEVGEIVEQIVSSFAEASEDKNFGVVMGRVMGKVKGKADGKLVAEVVKEKLAG